MAVAAAAVVVVECARARACVCVSWGAFALLATRATKHIQPWGMLARHASRACGCGTDVNANSWAERRHW